MKKMTKRKSRKLRLFRFIFRMILLISFVFVIVKFGKAIIGKDIEDNEPFQIIKDTFVKQQGRITIKNIDGDSELPIKNSRFSITNIDTGEVADTITTDKDGIAVSDLLDYDNVYEIKLIESHPYYQSGKDDILTLEIDQENQEIIIQNKMNEYIKHVQQTEDGEFIIDEVYIDVPTVMQNPELPNGCEITSLTSVLNYKGYNAEKTEMADVYLPKEAFYVKNEKLYGANPYKSYAGNPREKNGFFSYAPPIVEAANSYLDTVQGKEKPIDISNSTREEIIDYLNQGIPVVIWVTLDLSKPKINYSWYLSDTGEKTDMPINLHCVVLNGYAGDNVHVMNPLKGQVAYDADAFFQSYVELGSHAVILH
ncbi:C39 family peptidase [Proteiniborus sp. MB09-C3]|uniref:C39 family peptidase n=1 Tax=Proteiniborus sp. MB09-C3 TaxID=3050072 RepID=UPI00255368A7|nr:C39 family peptidase [Proteiniborus sp. MB09-C3]WIV13326.1 C39 family peptidase [Proteiniborus sp. MB09-C3]